MVLIINHTIDLQQQFTNRLFFHIFSRLKKILYKIKLPALLIGTLSFGGFGLETLYVLSARVEVQFTGGSNFGPFSPYEGKMYAIKGLPYRGYCGTRAII